MLTIIWIALLATCAVTFGYRGAGKLKCGAIDDFSASVVSIGLAFAASACVLDLAWSYTVVPYYDWLDALLPQHGTDIHELTLLVLAGMGGLLLWCLPILIGFALEELRQRLKARGVPVVRES